jgi:hypothetical protein
VLQLVINCANHAYTGSDGDRAPKRSCELTRLALLDSKIHQLDTKISTGMRISGAAVPDGYYCPAHAAALEAVLMEGGFDEPEDPWR